MTRPKLRTGLELVERPARVEASLWRRYRDEAGPECREALFSRYVPLARTLAARHFRRRIAGPGELPDYQQLAYEGLLQAMDRFDPSLGVPFQAFASRRIAGNIADGIARMSEVQAQISQRRRIEQDRLRSLSAESPAERRGGDPVAELADLAVGLALGFMLEANPVDPAPTAYDRLEFRQMQARLAEAMRKLPENEAIIVRQHYENGLSFAQIAELMGLSRGRISQLHRSALGRLRKKIGSFR